MEGKIIINRTIAGLFSLIILFIASFFSYVSVDFVLENNGSLITIFSSYFVFAWAYMVFFMIFLSIALIFPYKHAQKALLLGFTISILFLLAGFISNSTLLLLLTPFSYFDFIGIFLEEITLIDILPKAIICTLISLMIYLISLRNFVRKKDRLV